MRQTPRNSATGTTRRPPQSPVAAAPVYEDFRPTIEWQEDEESNTLLLIYLPGFQRENLRVSTEGRKTLKATGETLIAGNKWSRFQEDYPLPEDCNVRGIRAKFEGGILTIIIPKKGESAKEYAPTEATKPATKPATEPSQKPPENQPAQQSSQKQPAAPQKTEQDAGSNYIAGPNGIPSAKKARVPTGITQETPAYEQRMSKEKEDSKKSSKDKPEESDYKKESIEKIMEKWNDQKVTTADDGADKRPMPLIKKPDQKSEEQSSNYPKGVQKMKDVQKSEQASDHQKTTDAQEIKKAPDQVKDIPQETKEKPKLEKKDEGEILEPKERKTTTPTAAASSSRDYKQTVRKFLDVKEERQLLVNVGAAALVIVAFGAYLAYTLS